MNTDKFEANKTAAYTTLKEYNAAVRRSQRRIKLLLDTEPDGTGSNVSALAIARAAHKFLLACRAKFKETGIPVSADVLKQGLAQGVDPGAEPGKLFTPEGERRLDELARMMGVKPLESMAPFSHTVSKPTAAEVQPLLARDRAREFVPSARVIRERVHAGAMALQPRYAPDDSRCQGLGYKVTQRKAESKRRVMVLGVTPKFPSERYLTQRMGSGSARITVNGLTW